MGLVCKYISKSANGKCNLYYLFKNEYYLILCKRFFGFCICKDKNVA